MNVICQPQTYTCGRCKRNFQDRSAAEKCCTQYVKEFHMCIDIEGFLKQKNLDGVFSNKETGVKMTDSEVREYLRDCLAKGWQVLPTCNCPDFDYQTGCIGRAINHSEGVEHNELDT